MKHTLLIVLTAFVFTTSANAQMAAKSVYVELGGPGLASINYDTRFSKREDGIGGRAGIGYISSGDEHLLTVPVGLTYLLGKDEKNYFEVGGGVTYVNYSGFFSGDGAFNSTFGHLTFGYRLQPKNGGFLFRAAIVPVFGEGGFIPYYAGVGFGYKF